MLVALTLQSHGGGEDRGGAGLVVAVVVAVAAARHPRRADHGGAGAGRHRVVGQRVAHLHGGRRRRVAVLAPDLAALAAELRVRARQLARRQPRRVHRRQRAGRVEALVRQIRVVHREMSE